MTNQPVILDLQYVFDGVGQNWQKFKGSCILITGGTGIIGKWLIATLLHADKQLNLGVSVTLLTREPHVFRLAFPNLAFDRRVTLLPGNVNNFMFPRNVEYEYIIHAATDVVSARSAEDVLTTCVNGTHQVIECAKKCGTSRLLFLSSGAVYGKTPADLGAIPESFIGTLNWLSVDSAYAQGKRVAELICSIENAKGNIAIPVARCFAMVGPFLPLNKHFAIGNFISSAINKKSIVIYGDGKPVRSYLYLADVALCLWLLLIKGRGGVAYNVGSDEPHSIEALAQLVSRKLGSDIDIQIKNNSVLSSNADVYYPDTNLIRHELDLPEHINLEDAIFRTADWYRNILPHGEK